MASRVVVCAVVRLRLVITCTDVIEMSVINRAVPIWTVYIDQSFRQAIESYNLKIGILVWVLPVGLGDVGCHTESRGFAVPRL
jgi:hypothetical protein